MDEQNTILNTNPTRYIVAGVLVIVLFFGGLTVWSVFFPFQGAVIASGMVTVSGERKTVQHFEGGIIDKIFVKDGDKVKEGDVLIVLKSSHVSSNVDLLKGRLWAKMAEAARLKAEANLQSSITWPTEFDELSQNHEVNKCKAAEQDLFASKRSDIHGKKDLYRSQIMQLGNRIDGSTLELRSINDIVKNLEDDLNSKAPLVQEKYLGKSSILELQRVLAENKGRKGKLTQDIAQLHQMIEELKLRIMDLDTQYKDQALSKLKEATDDIFQIKEQIKPQVDAEERLKIRAPVDGIVINMQVHSEGSGVVTPARPVLEVVPENASMIIKAEVKPQDITSIRVGQETKIQLSAFQRQSTPPVHGQIIYVSPDLISKESGHGLVSYYEVHAMVDENDLKAKGAFLSPGMPVACYITTDKRTVISYLLGPLLKGFDTALRE